MKIILGTAAALLATLVGLVVATKTTSEPEPRSTIANRAARIDTVVAAPGSRSRAARAEAPSIAAPASRADPGQEADFSIASQRARLEDRFAAETPDATWAATAQGDLHADLRRFETRDVGIRDVQCRASMCRIEFALATRDSASEFMESWLRKRTWTGPGMADNDVVGADGKPRMVMFLGREGHELLAQTNEAELGAGRD